MTEDSLDIERHDQLTAYLKQTGRINADESPRVTTLAGGVSNRTVLVQRAGGESWVLKQALAKLRVKVDWFSDPARVHREALGLMHLHQLAPPGTITPLIFEDESQHLLAMAAVPQPHENLKTLMLSGTLDLQAIAGHADALGDMLGWIHRESGKRNRTLAKIFDDRQFFESLRLEPYYVYTSEQQPRSKAFYGKLIDATLSRRHTLVHGDFSPKNVLVHDNKLVLLDHEVIHWGDPAFDVGFMLAHLLSKARHMPGHRSSFVIAAHKFWISYYIQIKKAGWRKDLEVWAARHTLGCLLARVDGRSPLEYLTPPEREQQREDVLQLMQRFMLAWAVDASELIDAYAEKLAAK